MDPNIRKLFEEDEDETMPSGAYVNAFTAKLKRDIEGGNASTSHQPSDSNRKPCLRESVIRKINFFSRGKHLAMMNTLISKRERYIDYGAKGSASNSIGVTTGWV